MCNALRALSVGCKRDTTPQWYKSDTQGTSCSLASQVLGTLEPVTPWHKHRFGHRAQGFKVTARASPPIGGFGWHAQPIGGPTAAPPGQRVSLQERRRVPGLCFGGKASRISRSPLPVSARTLFDSLLQKFYCTPRRPSPPGAKCLREISRDALKGVPLARKVGQTGTDLTHGTCAAPRCLAAGATLDEGWPIPMSFVLR